MDLISDCSVSWQCKLYEAGVLSVTTLSPMTRIPGITGASSVFLGLRKYLPLKWNNTEKFTKSPGLGKHYKIKMLTGT